MNTEAMQRLTGTLEDAKAANRAAAAALRALEDDEEILDNLGSDDAAPDAATRIGRMIIATDYSTDSNGSDDAAIELEEMIAEALSVRFSNTAHAEWQRNGGYTLTAIVRDDGADVASIAASGATMWDAAVNLAMATGYHTFGDF